MLSYINWRMRVTVGHDGRQLVGTFMAFDKHMNIVLGDCEEHRTIKKKRGAKTIEERDEKRTLGLVLLRGENVVSIQVEAPPQEEARSTLPPGVGSATAAGRGTAMAPIMQAPPMAFNGPPMGMPPMGGRGRGMAMPPGMMAPPPGMMPPGMMHPPR